MPASSLARALGLILHGPAKSAHKDIVLLDYRDPATFSALWLNGLKSGKVEIDGQAMDKTDSVKRFLLIGEDPPDGIFDTKLPGFTGINFRSHFTAASWLAAWKVNFPDSKVSIAVIDPRPAGSVTGMSQALQTIFAARDATGLPLVPGAVLLNSPRLDAICQSLKRAKDDTKSLAKDAPHLREILKSTIWNELTSNREQHHALSNVLGPVILSGKKIDENCFKPGGPDDNSEHQHQAAASDRASLLLRRLLSACGRVSWEDKKADGQESQSSETGKDIQICLLDDQTKQGWEDWVKECLPDAAGTMQVAVDPTDLVVAITKALSDDQGNFVHKDARFRLELPGLAAALHPVLLLDLRLFSGKVTAEREFLKTKLLPLVNHFIDKPGLTWPGFSTNAPLFQPARAAVENGTLKPDTDEHHEVLTWLPRVVALADMSLPIILFSSTGRRDLVEPFKSYGNIITSFEKPRLNDLAAAGTDGIAPGIRASAATALRRAVAQGRRWLSFRQAAQSALQMQKETPLEAPQVNGVPITHFEIYFDESGSSREDGFRVAALVAGYSSATHADEVAQSMHDAGVSWFHQSGNPVIYDKIQSRNPNIVSKWTCHFAPCLEPIWLMPVVLWSNPATGETSSDALNADTLLQSLVGELLEMLLFVLLPSSPEVTYAIYGAQRRIAIEASAFEAVIPLTAGASSVCVDANWLDQNNVVVSVASQEAVADFKRKWAVDEAAIVYDVHSQGGRALFLSIRSGQDYAGILAKAFQSRPWEEPWKSHTEHIGVRFSPLNHPERATLPNMDRPVHILADLLPGDATWDGVSGASLNATAGFFTASTHQPPVLVAEGAEFSRLMGACRALDGGDYALALAQFSLLEGEFRAHAAPFYDAVGQKLSDKINLLEGRHLVGALHHQDAKRSTLAEKLPFSRIHVRHQHWTRYPRPAPNDVQALKDYATSHVLAAFAIPSSECEQNLAEWMVRKAMATMYPGLVTRNVEFFTECAIGHLFAVMSCDSQNSPIPYREWKINMPPTLCSRGTIKLSLGGVPVGRLEREGGGVRWIDAQPANLVDERWTSAQIEAVINTNQPKKLKPLSFHDAARATAKINSSPRWHEDDNGNIVLFLLENDLTCASQAVKRDLGVTPLSPDDFDSSGQFLHSKEAWPSFRRYRALSTVASSEGRRSQPFRPRLPRQKWMILQFADEKTYTDNGANWHDRENEGFYVRKPNNPYNTKITVYADTDFVTDLIPHGFSPAQANQVGPNCKPKGIPWRPNQGSLENRMKESEASSHPDSSSPNQVRQVWIGPVPRSLNSDNLIRELGVRFPDWRVLNEWTGGNQKGWWLPLERVADGAGTLPAVVHVSNHQLNVRTTEPET